MSLNLQPNIPDPDGFYQELIDSQRDMTDAEAQMMNCKLVLVLANHIGDREVLRAALLVAGGRVEPV
jgi:predicted LPLAT superfamily acyltransferase